MKKKHKYSKNEVVILNIFLRRNQNHISANNDGRQMVQSLKFQ